MFEQEQQDAVRVVEEFLKQAKLKKGDLVVIGCSTSEIASHRIGSYSNADLGEAVFLAMQGAFAKEEISIATQCCEHLNRALIIERKDAECFGYEEVNVVPQPKARRFILHSCMEAYAGSCGSRAYSGKRRH